MKYLLTTLLLSLTVIAHGQTISVSPTSIPLWGQIRQTAKISIEYKDFELVGVHAFEDYYDTEMTPVQKSNGYVIKRPGKYEGTYIGLFYTPLDYSYRGFEVDAGAGFWNRKFPTRHGVRFHFTLSLSYMITDDIGVGWSHMSNGFGVIDNLNPGLDHLSIKVRF